MARRRRAITREDLLHRFATIGGATYGEAFDLHKGTDLDELRSLVETLEGERQEPFNVRRARFTGQTTALAGQTTTTQGETT